VTRPDGVGVAAGAAEAALALICPTGANQPTRENGYESAHASKSEEILRASLGLFAKKGFRGTTTREIAAEVGLKQASLFHYFPSKEDILRELLDRLVRKSLLLSKSLKGSELPAAAKLWLLVYVDVRELAVDNYQGVRLMLLPTSRGTSYADFWAMRDQLREHYRELVQLTLMEAGADLEGLDLKSDLVFGITEAPVSWCETAPRPVQTVPTETANAVLAYLLHDHGAVASARSRAQEQLRDERWLSEAA
jgi:AcrR family transcriptional regulator